MLIMSSSVLDNSTWVEEGSRILERGRGLGAGIRISKSLKTAHSGAHIRRFSLVLFVNVGGPSNGDLVLRVA